MYLFQRQGKEYKVIDKEWENVRDQLVNMRTNGGFPYLVVEDGDYLKTESYTLNIVTKESSSI